jgi:hypothetical protein
MNWKTAIHVMGLWLVLAACQSDSTAGGEILPETEPVAIETLYPDPATLDSPAAIDGWVQQIGAEEDELEKSGPYTIARLQGNYEVSAAIAGGEIIRLHARLPGGLADHWYYLNQNYQVSALREQGRTREGTYYQEWFYYGPDKKLLLAKHRRARSQEQLAGKPWRRFSPQTEDDFRFNYGKVEISALGFVSGK